ncbi:MAG: glycosyltransferase family 4 protein [Vicinamibacterales bacterium]
MSRIAVVTSSPPLAEGGHMVIARSLVQALHEAGHDADIVVTPQNRFGRQAAAYMATWLTDLGVGEHGRVDQVITLRYPSYAVRHDRHVCWLNHTMREYYDLWDRFSGALSPQGRLKERIRRSLIHSVDRYLLTRNVDRLFTISGTVKARLAIWPSLHATVLYPPAPPRAYRCDRYGDFIFMVSRLTPLKRADLLIDALATPEGAGVKAVIAGDGSERDRLARLIADRHIADRVTLPGALTEAELLHYLAHCRAVCFPPLNEDYGFVTVEAFASRKPVVTCLDSGGPAELVQDGVHGFVCEPTPPALATRLRQLLDDPALAERLGGEGHARGSALTWGGVVEGLTQF